MRRSLRTTTLLVLLLGGCARTATFDISVKNTTAEPLQMGTVKFGRPMEAKWMSPEDLAIGAPGRPDAPWGVIVPPGQVVTLRTSGQFASGSGAFLRIFLGEHRLSELLAIGRRDTARVDLPLYIGTNTFVVSDRGGRLVGDRVLPPLPMNPPSAASLPRPQAEPPPAVFL